MARPGIETMIPDYPWFPMRSTSNKRRCTPALLILLAGAFVSAHAQPGQPPSKVAVNASPAMQVTQADTASQTDTEIPPLVVEPTSTNTVPSSREVMLPPETIPGLEAAKVPPAPEGADPDSPPIYISGEHMEGYVDSEVVVQGRGQLIRDTTVVQGEELTYNRQTEIATACGDVRVNYNGNLFTGKQVRLHVPTNEGYFEAMHYRVGSTGAHGESSQTDFTGQNRMTLHDATYTLCEARDNGRYDWVLSATSVDLDFDKDEGVAHGAVMRFMGVPILATPHMSFPLSDKRRSGLLVPTFDLDSDNGFTYEQPYYWNIAPNYDATITPFGMSKRGVGAGVEFRYLQPAFNGTFSGMFLPNDRLRNGNGVSISPDLYASWHARDPGLLHDLLQEKKDRWAYSLFHQQNLTQDAPLIGRAGFYLNLNRVSDDNYWRDFPRSSLGARTSNFSSRQLESVGVLSTSNGNFSSMVRVQRWQTLQDLESYIVPPFDRTQLRLNYGQEDVYGFDFSVMGDMTKFESDRLANETNENGVRSMAQFALSYPMRQPGWFVIPKVQMLGRYYDFDDDVAWQSNPHDPLSVYRTSRHRHITLPTYSLDAGLIFERDARLFGTDYLQTLEPRVLYTYTPYRDQSMLPLYDTGSYDYNLATIYLDNPYSGYDRIADVNMLTAGVGTRWQNPQSGVEVLSLNLAQRIRFADQRVTLDDEPITARYSDVLLSASTELIKNWRFDALLQYDTDENRSQRSLLMARWKPGQYRVMNLGYRMVHGFSEQVDYSWQWPLGSPWFGSALPDPNKNGGRWYSVGRVNYSLRDSKLVDGILGFEYQSCCWVARVAMERISTGRTEANSRLLFQLEFSGFSRVGINPLQTLQDNINHYEIIRSERIIRPNDFYLYE